MAKIPGIPGPRPRPSVELPEPVKVTPQQRLKDQARFDQEFDRLFKASKPGAKIRDVPQK